MTLATSSTCHVDAHFLSIILGWRIPFPGFRNPPESTRIRPFTECVRIRNPFCGVKMPMQTYCTVEYSKTFPCRAAGHPPESTRIRPSTESVRTPSQVLFCIV